MADKSNIEWTDATWNPIVGCSIVSPGCTNCYAMAMAARIDKMTLASHYEGLTKKVNGHQVWTGEVALANDHIASAPLRWRRPRRIFVNSMGDLFHEAIPDEWIDRVFAVMALCPQHTFQVLTKRAERMRAYLNDRLLAQRIAAAIDADNVALGVAAGDRYYETCFEDNQTRVLLPLPNVWLGVSCEDQKHADERIPHLLQTPAAIRFVSAEPLLGPISFRWAKWDNWCHADGRPRPVVTEHDGLRMLDWVIVGGESGPGARPMHVGWARDIRDQCSAAGIAFFFKQFGEWHPATDKPGIAEHCIAINGAISRGDELQGGPEKRPRWIAIERVGKKRAGRTLDGREHNEFPKVAA